MFIQPLHDNIFVLFFILVCFHFICDFPLQGDFLAKAKNKFNAIPGVPWYQALFAHAFIQAGFVFLATASMACATFEFFAHTYIDYAKTMADQKNPDNKSFHYDLDQILHISCKALICAFIFVNR